jgi:hypothetical protein
MRGKTSTDRQREFENGAAEYRDPLQINADNTQLDSFSEKVLGAVFEVANTLGAGFLETRPPRHAGYRGSFICM